MAHRKDLTGMTATPTWRTSVWVDAITEAFDAENTRHIHELIAARRNVSPSRVHINELGRVEIGRL
jgi:hypothetical protein